MISSKSDYFYYLKADRIASAIPRTVPLKSKLINLFFPDYIWKFQKTLRKLEYYNNCKTGFFALVLRFIISLKFKKLSYKLGFSIPPNVFGPGLSIAHPGTIVINSNTQVGANCRIHTCVNIGTKAGHGNLAPKIGDNCYIGPGTKMYGNIILANNITIVPNSVVNKSFFQENIVIAGIPAKKLIHFNTLSIIIPATLIIKRGLVNEAETIISRKNDNMTKEINNLLTGSA